MIAYKHKKTRRGWLKVFIFLAVFILGMTITFSEVEGAPVSPEMSVHLSD